MKLSEAVDELLIATSAAGRSDRTVRDYAEKAACLVDYLGDKEIDQLTAGDLRRFVEGLRKRTSRFEQHPNRETLSGGLSPASVAAYVRVVRRLFSFLVEEELLDKNPAHRLKAPRTARGKPKAISQPDLQKLLESTDIATVVGKRDRALILLLADSGCRVGGLVRIDVDDVDLERCRVILREKGEKVRYGFFSEPTKHAIQDWLEVRPNDKGTRLFVSLGTRGDAHLTEQGVREMLRRLKKKSGVKGPVNPHSFRHGFARQYLTNGGNLASLADTMGHSDVHVTWQSYGIFTIDELKAAHAKYSPVAQLERDGIL